MGLFDAVRAAFARRPPTDVLKPGDPLRIGAAGKARLASLPEGHGIHVWTREVDGGRSVVVDEGPAQGPPPAVLVDLPVTLSDDDLQRLRGVRLDHVDGAWRIEVGLTLHGRDTPNPDGRLYVTDRVLAVGRPVFAADPASATGLAARLLSLRGVRTALLRDETATIERVPGTPWPELDAAVESALRTWALQLGESDVGTAPVATGLEAEVMAVLQERILPGIHRDGGDLQFVGLHDGVARVSLHGACRTCPSSTATLRLGVERALTDAFPGRILSVEAV